MIAAKSLRKPRGAIAQTNCSNFLAECIMGLTVSASRLLQEVLVTTGNCNAKPSFFAAISEELK